MAVGSAVAETVLVGCDKAFRDVGVGIGVEFLIGSLDVIFAAGVIGTCSSWDMSMSSLLALSL